METRLSLGGAGGTLTVRQEGTRTVLEAQRADDGRGLYKVWLPGRDGGLLLGALMPEGGRLHLRRALPVGELERRGLWPVERGESRLAFSFGAERREEPAPPPGWSWERDPARLLGDALLRRAAENLRGAVRRQEEGGFALGVPWQSDKEFPLTALFCFAHIQELGGKRWAVFHFSGRGCPVFPAEKNGSGGA